jgi:hypothetical protein
MQLDMSVGKDCKRRDLFDMNDFNVFQRRRLLHSLSTLNSVMNTQKIESTFQFLDLPIQKPSRVSPTAIQIHADYPILSESVANY